MLFCKLFIDESAALWLTKLLRVDAERGDTAPGESDLALAALGSTGDIFQMNES